MDKTHITTKIWKGTLKKLRIVYALTGESMVQILDRIITQELERVRGLEDAK